MLKCNDVNTPVMGLLMKNGAMKFRDFTGPLAIHFKFADGDVSEAYQVGIEAFRTPDTVNNYIEKQRVI